MDGKRYADLISGIGVSSLGHCHPAVVKAVQEQAAKFMHLMVYGEYVYSPQVQLSKALAEILPENLNSVYITNSGTEAAEGALKLAKRYTGRTRIVSFKNAYHGSTHGALSVMGSEYFKNAYRPLLPDVQFLEYNNVTDLENISCRTAAVIVETIQGEAGAVVPDAGFLQTLRKKCTDMGALLILDEIQCGFGRTGKFFAFEHFGIVPDILLTAKAMGGGMPIGAFISSKEIMDSLTHNPVLGHITTFGGHPVSCAAALATLIVLRDSDIIDRVEEKGQLFRKHLQHPAIKAIHGKGLLLSVEFENHELLLKIIGRCIANGIITDWFLFSDNRMRLAPPLIITAEQIEECSAVIVKSIKEVL
ncbi:MAG: aspartate aminotransferase family protein [Sphingobacteriales bacterium JAD_PAG50586_3]|nr:MAG: aspartate aminotransferase family protein [Sphingobacteriales bacterium JAD_PAG50586_3]